MKQSVVGIIILALLFLLACNPDNPEHKRLVGHTWYLVSLNNEVEPLTADSNRFILSFSDSTYSGRAYCNEFHGKYKFKKQYQIAFKKATVTQLVCRDLALEQQYVKVIERAQRYSFDGDTLFLICSHNKCAAFLPYVNKPDLATTLTNLYGIYKGVYPAEDESVIDVTLQLRENGDFEYIMEFVNRKSTVALSGKFVVEGARLMLESEDGVMFFQIDKDLLKQLSPEGQPIKGEQADWYVVRKIY